MQMLYKDINLHNLELIISAGRADQLIKGGIPQVAFSGRSNVGKSSLINSLLGRKSFARVSKEPGKTITVNYYEVDKKMYLVDLPGYGFAKRSKDSKKAWSTLTEEYFIENPSLMLVLQLVDIKVGPTEDDQAMIEFMNYYNIPYKIIATKCDRPNKSELQKFAAKIATYRYFRPRTEVILYSAEKNMGRDELWSRILAASFS